MGVELVRVVSTLNVPIPPGGRTQYVTAEGIYPFRARLLQSAHAVDGIVKGLAFEGWPRDGWQALRRLAVDLAQAGAKG